MAYPRPLTITSDRYPRTGPHPAATVVKVVDLLRAVARGGVSPSRGGLQYPLLCALS